MEPDSTGNPLAVGASDARRVEVEAAIAALERFRAVGIQVALDDFGTGYSSLAYLAQFHCRQVKIDRFFTSRLDLDDHSGRAIVAAIIVSVHV